MDSFADRLLGSLLRSLSSYTPREIEAVRSGTLFRGMSRSAADASIGLSDKENDWGRGGKQVIYLGGRIVVYLDHDDKVVDWQMFDKN
jgi:hypothetical protein